MKWWIKLFSMLVLSAGLGYGSVALAVTGVTITAATGGGAIPSNTNGATGSGVYTALTGPELTELNPGGMSNTGTIILNAPAGFAFDPLTAVTAKVTPVAGKNCDASRGLLLGSSSGSFTQTVTPTTSTIAINVFRISSPPDQCIITYSNINVRPTSGFPLASGNITRTGTVIFTENPATTNYGTLTEIVGPPTVTTNAATSVTTTGAMLNGTVSSNGVSTTVTFNYGLTTGYGSSITATQSPLTAGASGTAVSAAVSGLACNTLYHFQAIGMNSAGTTNGGDLTFTTLACSVVVASFNVVEPAADAVSGKIFTKIAGQSLALDIVALNASNAISTDFTGAVAVEVVDNTSGGGVCANMTVIATFTDQTFTAGDAGRHSLSSPNTVSDVWPNAKVRIKYPTGSPTVIGCSGDNFAIRPNSLSVSVTDTNWQTAGSARTLNNSGATGGNVHKAGQPFTIQATAYNVATTITGNYAGSPAIQAVACTLPMPTCTNGILTLGGWTAAGGTVTSTTATYSEAGSFNLALQDTTFASVDAADGTPATCAGYYVCSAAVSVGRFAPDHFALIANNTPQFKTFNNAACAFRSFTYIGQPFGYVTAPQIFVTAQNASNNTTLNYRNNLWKLAIAAGTQDCTTNPDICTLTSGSATQIYTYTTAPAATPNWDSTQVFLGSPSIAANNDGTGTVTSTSGDLLAFKRSLTTPQALFDASITLTESVKDTSEAGNCGVANCDITTTAPVTFSNIAFDAGNEFRYGRLKLSNAHGSELLSLPITFQTQYWNGTSFVINTADNCTMLATNNVKLIAPPAGVSATVGGAFSSGVGSLTLSPPTTAAKVAVDLCVDLGADPVGGTVCSATASANLPYLHGLWSPGTSYNNDPSARATFGVYKGSKEFIYLRENY